MSFVLNILIYFIREFVNKHYAQIKTANPKTPILIRECSGVQPRLWARYGKFLLSCNPGLIVLVFLFFFFKIWAKKSQLVLQMPLQKMSLSMFKDMELQIFELNFYDSKIKGH